jgi:hypothetical protein
MPPRPHAPQPAVNPDWNALLQPARTRVNAPKPPQRLPVRRPSSLDEALCRFVERNWD